MLKGKLGVIALAAAAYGIYKYSKLSPEDKNALKARGKDFLDKNLGGLDNILGRKAKPANGTAN